MECINSPESVQQPDQIDILVIDKKAECAHYSTHGDDKEIEEMDIDSDYSFGIGNESAG